MRLLIASDLHGSIDNLRFLVNRVHELKPDIFVLLGDLVYHGPRNPLPEAYDTLAMLAEAPSLTNLPCPLLAVRGNCDGEVDVMQLPFAMPESAWIDVNGQRIFASHGHRLPENPPFPGLAPGAVILRGHTHIPRAERSGSFQIWNPGSISLPKGGYPASYAIYENGIFRVLDRAGNEIMRN